MIVFWETVTCALWRTAEQKQCCNRVVLLRIVTIIVSNYCYHVWALKLSHSSKSQCHIPMPSLRPIYTRRYSGGIPRGIAHLSNQRTFIYFCVTPERYASGIAPDRFQSDIPAGSRSPAVHLTNQRFCFAVVMPLPVTGLAGSDAYLGHQKTRCRRV